MDINELVTFGITKTEARVYLEIAKTDETTIGPVIKRTGLHRGTVYNCINDLVEKGFISFIERGGLRYYKPSGKTIFENVIREKEEKIVHEKKDLDIFFRNLAKLKEQDPEQDVQVFYGISAFKSLFLEIYNECKKHNWEYYFQGRGGEMQDATGTGFYKYTQKLKKAMNIKCRVILGQETKNLSYHRHVHGNIKYLPSKIKSPVNFWIYGNIVLLVLFGTNPLISIKIKSKALADAFRNYFEHLWKIARSS